MSSTIASYMTQGGGAYVHLLPTTTCSAGAAPAVTVHAGIIRPALVAVWSGDQPAAPPLGRVSSCGRVNYLRDAPHWSPRAHCAPVMSASKGLNLAPGGENWRGALRFAPVGDRRRRRHHVDKTPRAIRAGSFSSVSWAWGDEAARRRRKARVPCSWVIVRGRVTAVRR